MTPRFPFTSFPNGWYCVATSGDVSAAGVTSLRYFGQELVAFRTAGGVAQVFDAHCSRSGAPVGGKITESFLRGASHDWGLDDTSQCANFPCDLLDTPEARFRVWPTREVNGVIMVYYHALGAAPTWEIPELPERTSTEWLPFRLVDRRCARTHVQEAVEQSIDIAHMVFVHSTPFPEIQDLHIDGHILTARLVFNPRKSAVAKWFHRNTSYRIDVTLYGLGCNVHRCGSLANDASGLTTLFFFTPINEDYIELRIMLSMKQFLNRTLAAAILTWQVALFRKAVMADLLILENKIFLTKPLICQSDGPFFQYRRWARQFMRPALGGGVREKASAGATTKAV